MSKVREYLNLEGRHPQDLFAKLSGLNQQFPERGYKLAFDLQPLKTGGYRATIKYFVDPETQKSAFPETQVTHMDDFASTIRAGRDVQYFGDPDEQVRFDAAIEADSAALEVRLGKEQEQKKQRWGKEVVLSALVDGTLSGVSENYGVSQEELLQRAGITLFDLGETFGYPSTKSRKIPKGLAVDLGVDWEYLKDLRVNRII